jgi:hypothetical protein
MWGVGKILGDLGFSWRVYVGVVDFSGTLGLELAVHVRVGGGITGGLGFELSSKVGGWGELLGDLDLSCSVYVVIGLGELLGDLGLSCRVLVGIGEKWGYLELWVWAVGYNWGVDYWET